MSLSRWANGKGKQIELHSSLVRLIATVGLLWLGAGCDAGAPQASSPTLVPSLSLPAVPTDASDGTLASSPSDGSATLATPTPPPTEPPPPSPTPPPTLIWLAPGTPRPFVQAVADLVTAQPTHYALTDDDARADVQIGSNRAAGTPLAPWVYALVAPFSTLPDGVTWDDVRQNWAGNPQGPFAGRPLLMSPETQAALEATLGQPAPDAVVTVPPTQLLSRAWADQPAWAIVPFEALEPRWKVLRVDGRSPLDRDLDLEAYPLVVHLSAAGAGDADVTAVIEPFLAAANLPATNREEGRMTVVVMTGVTALTRATAWRMEQKGLTYPAQDVGDWLQRADVTHVSNEVAFDPDCGPPDPVQEGLLFCSDPRYVELLEHIGVDVVEMTGNHIADAGVEQIVPTLDTYVERGWQYFGGGRDLEDARQPAIFQHNGNAIAFLGCNPAGPPSVWATPERAGAAPCDYGLLFSQLAELRAQGILPLVTLQYWEMDRYDPTPQQIADFEALAEAGAVIVSGSHAHHAQGFGFHAGSLIHYGLGNLFFDQMELLGNRQEFIDRHVFYDGRHVSTELLTAMLEDWSRPRPMSPEERAELLQTVFAVSDWE